MSFNLRLTATGLAKMTAANLGGPPISLTHIAVGDGNGNPIPADATPSALLRQVLQNQINALYLNPNDPTMLMAEMVIPSNVGGFSIREIAVRDAAGDVFAIGRFPETYKPVAAEGGTRDMVIYAAIKVTNSANVQLVIDTSIVAATRPWVLATITTAYLLPGGLTGQVLVKKSNAPGDVEWKDPTASVNIAVNVRKESQVATANQQIFTLVVCTTDGVAVYIDGLREYDFTILNATQVQVAAPLAAGKKLLFVQNEPNEPLKLRRLVMGRAYFTGNF